MILPSAHSSRLPQARNPNAVNPRTTSMPRKRKKCWTDALCRLDSSLPPQYDSELDLGSPEGLIPRDEESSEEDRPFLPRFLLQEIIFAHSPYEGVFHNRPGLQGNLLCRSDWLRLRGISETECMILPIRELAAFPRCSVCEQLKAEARSSAPWPLPVPALLDDSRWQPDQVPRLGSSGAQTDLRLGARPLEVGFGCCWRLLPSCPQTGTSASGTISATAPSPRACPRSLPIRSSPLPSWKSPHQIRLALPQVGRAHRVGHHHVPGHCQLLMAAKPGRTQTFFFFFCKPKPQHGGQFLTKAEKYCPRTQIQRGVLSPKTTGSLSEQGREQKV